MIVHFILHGWRWAFVLKLFLKRQNQIHITLIIFMLLYVSYRFLLCLENGSSRAKKHESAVGFLPHPKSWKTCVTGPAVRLEAASHGWDGVLAEVVLKQELHQVILPLEVISWGTLVPGVSGIILLELPSSKRLKIKLFHVAGHDRHLHCWGRKQ